ncbi:MAG: YybH family protein [bacterium]
MGTCLVVLLAAVISCAGKSGVQEAQVKTAIETVMNQQVAGWNAGSVEKFMQGYLRSEKLRYASGGSVAYGWQPLLEHYQNAYPDKAAMGTLNFSELDITVLEPEAALVFGKWSLQRTNDHPWGYFTLVFRKTDVGWRIVHDHTSSASE